MKSSELRLGNLYLNYGKVTIVDADFIGRLASIEKRGKIAIDVSPIPITDEWLLKFGFEKIYESAFNIGYEYVDDYYNFITYHFQKPENIRYIRLSQKEIKVEFVHQLQNLFFVLTGGKELTIKTE